MKKIRLLRFMLNLTQDDLAARANCSRQMISAIELGIRQPSKNLLRRIAKILRIEESQLSPESSKEEA